MFASSIMKYILQLITLTILLFSSSCIKEYHEWEDESIFGINKLNSHTSFYAVESEELLEKIKSYPVSKYVNSPINNDQRCILKTQIEQ